MRIETVPVKLIVLASVVSVLAAANTVVADFITWRSTAALEIEHTASWPRLVRIRNGDWLAGYAVFGNQADSVIHIKRSTDQMRSWIYVTQITEPGRQLDNANLLQLANGDVLLAVRSLVPRKSYRVQVYRSSGDSRNFRFLSIIDGNEQPNGSESIGVWEPFLLELADGRIAAFYANEKHSTAKPGYSQIISERVSTDGGTSWGKEIWAVAQPGGVRVSQTSCVCLIINTCFSMSCVARSLAPDTFRSRQTV